jgi:hypothetical protein
MLEKFDLVCLIKAIFWTEGVKFVLVVLLDSATFVCLINSIIYMFYLFLI